MLGFFLMKAIGIDLDADVINLSIMSKNKDLINIKSLDISDIPKSDVKKLYIANKDNYLITSALDSSDVIIKSSDFNIKNSLFIKKAIKFHESSISTLDIDKVIISTIHFKNESKLKFFITTNFDNKVTIDYTNTLSSFVNTITLETLNVSEKQSEIFNYYSISLREAFGKINRQFHPWSNAQWF